MSNAMFSMSEEKKKYQLGIIYWKICLGLTSGTIYIEINKMSMFEGFLSFISFNQSVIFCKNPEGI